MCMEDIRIGRKSHMAASIVLIDNAVPTLLVPRSEKRIALMIPSINGDTLTFWPAKWTGTPSLPIMFGATSVLLLDIQHHGDMVKGPWYGLVSLVPLNVGIVEVLLDDM